MFLAPLCRYQNPSPKTLDLGFCEWSHLHQCLPQPTPSIPILPHFRGQIQLTQRLLDNVYNETPDSRSASECSAGHRAKRAKEKRSLDPEE